MTVEVKSSIVDIVTILFAVVCVVGNLVLFCRVCIRKRQKIIVCLIIVGTAAVDVVKMILDITVIVGTAAVNVVKMISEIVVVMCISADQIILVVIDRSITSRYFVVVHNI